MNYNKIKKFWIDNIKSKQKRWKIKDEKFSIANWENAINNTDDLEQLHELGVKLREEVAAKNWGVPLISKTKRKELSKKSWDKLMKIMMEELEQESEKGVALKSAFDHQANSISEFQNKLKVIVGNDLTNWESKIVKAGSSDKDITDLQKQVNDLTNNKDNLDKELKQKQQQILNHKCDTPNGEELNQLKEDLKKANEEKEELERKLNEPIPSQEKEEDTKDLSIEELRTKLNEKNIVIGKLKARLDKMETEAKNNPNVTQNSSKSNGLAWGISSSLLTAVIMMVVFGLLLKRKKKRKK